MAGKGSFGVSTHLYHGSRLSRGHLLEIAAHGFEAVEVCATRTHFDYHNVASVADLRQWLGETGLRLASVHAPVGERFSGGRHGALLTLASTDPGARARALDETVRALQIAHTIPFDILVTHVGLPRTGQLSPGDNNRDSARRSIEALQALAAPLGVRVAVEVLQNELSRPAALAEFVESVLDVADVGICLDMGHAHMDGDLVEAIETVAEHLVAIDVHDNRRSTDDHLVPFDGTIDWAGGLTALQKVGYDGTLMLELGFRGTTRDTLARARSACQKMEKLLAAR